jgi:XTP/dITP diphosphohydrolase
MDKQELIVATGNTGKINEIRAICKDIPVSIVSLKDIWADVPVIPETGSTFEENASIKAGWVFSRKKTWTLADDSGLEVDALNGEPGVFSSRYAGEHANDEKNIHTLLKKIEGVPSEQRNARFRCVMCLMGPENTERIVSGVCEGTITFEPRGNNGFGYDPVFIPRGYDRTFAEMEQSVKNNISHRGQALLALKEGLYELFR